MEKINDLDAVHFLLTFVVPAYNVEKYLADCLDSLVNQTVMRHHIIIVNDGSTDNTANIAKDYVKKFPSMISYIEQGNKGLGAARNVGLKFVETPYVIFLDSDDWQNLKFVEKFEKVLEKYDEQPDIIFTLPWVYDSSSKRIYEWYDKQIFDDIFFIYENTNSGSRIVNVSTDKKILQLEVNACRRIYSVNFLRKNNFYFPEGVKWEDVKPHFELLHRAKLCIAIRDIGFFYRTNTGSQITSGTGATRLDTIKVFRDTFDMAFREKFNKYEIAYIIRALFPFTTWGIRVTDTENIMPFLKGMHTLFLSIPKKYFRLYFMTCSPHRRTEKAKLFFLRSPFYGVLSDYRIRDFGMKVARKLVRK